MILSNNRGWKWTSFGIECILGVHYGLKLLLFKDFSISSIMSNLLVAGKLGWLLVFSS